MVCIVDDDVSVRESLVGLIKLLGFPVHEFSSAEAFLAARPQLPVACLILDVRMPGMNGLGLQDYLCSVPDAIPIIFVTALLEDDVRQRAMDRGAIAFLEKPFDDAALTEALQRVMSMEGQA